MVILMYTELISFLMVTPNIQPWACILEHQHCLHVMMMMDTHGLSLVQVCLNIVKSKVTELQDRDVTMRIRKSKLGQSI
jgi:hypothetical protein